MVEQVNRLIGNLLAAGGEVYLPEVGSLSSERRPATRISKREVIPPHRTVTYTSQPRGASLVDEIARVIRNATPEVDAEAQAKDVYRRWLSRVVEEDVMTLDGIGVLRNKNFTVDEAFDLRLNPQGHAPVRIPQRGGFDWVMGIGIVAAVAVCGFVGYWWFTQNSTIKPTQSAPVEVAETPVTAPEAAQEETPAIDTLATVSEPTTEVAPEVTPKPEVRPEPAQPAADPTVPVRMERGRCYVVLGVFSTTNNAKRALRNAKEKVGFDCRIYNYGSKFIVSPFEDDSSAACDRFINENAKRQPDMWRHIAR